MTQQEGGKRSRLLLKRFDADPFTTSSIVLTAVTDIASMGLMPGLAALLVR